MRDVLDELLEWWTNGQVTGMATVVSTWSSAPRTAGAAMLVGPDGSAVGSISGGCVESAAYEAATEVRDCGTTRRERWGIGDDDAASVGLTCGGTIEVFVESVDRWRFPEFGEVAADIRAGRPVAVATVVSGPRTGAHLVLRVAATTLGSLGSARLDDAVREDALGMLVQGSSGVVRYGPDGERRGDDIEVFVASYAPKPRMIVFGAIDFAAAVARMGSFLGYRVTVCDARPVFATRKRFPEADEVVIEWPHRYLAGTDVDERTVVCVLTHDPKFDIPLLEVALRLPLAYVGAMGSRRTNDERLEALRDRGLEEHELKRLRAPIGLDLGARTPQETAVSVAAEIIGERWGGSLRPLTDSHGPIHHVPHRH